MAIIYTPQERTDPRNCPHRVYVSCHPEDLTLFDTLSRQLRKLAPDCVIAYLDPKTPPEQTHFMELEDFPLVVIPVTGLWFSAGFHQEEFDRLVEQKRPILPLLVDNGIEDAFNARSGNLQFLRFSDRDYGEKLERSLQSMLLEQDLIDRVRKVFTHKMFIGYCREDFEKVQELIRCLHSEETGRRLSIWFDKYLPTGRDFAQSILTELDDSHVFGVATTPNLVGRDNYVKNTEYPHALQEDKRIVFFGMEPADWKTLQSQLLRGEEQVLIPAGQTTAFANYIRKLLQEVKGAQEVADPREWEYLLGLAYRNGIGVEYDYPYAMKKFKSAAREGDYRAAHSLADMYFHGIGVRPDLEQAMKWYAKEVKLLDQQFREEIMEIRAIPTPMTAVTKDGRTLHVGKPTVETVKEQLLELAGFFVGRASCNARILRDHGHWEETQRAYDIVLKALNWTQTVANQVGILARYGLDLRNERNQFMIYRGKGDPQECRLAWEEASGAFREDSPQSCYTAVKAGHNYGVVLLKEDPRSSRDIFEQTLALIDRCREPNRITREIELLLRRDVGNSYLAEETQDRQQRINHAMRALEMLKSQWQLFETYPFDLEANPDLQGMLMWNRFYTGEAAAHAQLYDEAFQCYVWALEEAKKTEQKLGELSQQRDLPITFLQLYGTVAQRLLGYEYIPPEVKTRLEELLRQYEKVQFQAEHKPKAEKYLENLRKALQK